MRALICGAGIAGLALAWHLERDGWDVELVEAAPAFRDGGYMIDFYGPGLEIARRMGIEPALLAARYDVNTIDFRNADGRRTSGFRVPQAVADLISLLRGDLARAIADGVRSPVRYGVSVAALDDRGDRVDVTLTDGTERTVDLLIGADGVHSRIRRLLFGDEEQFTRYLGHHVAAYFVRDETLSRRVGTRYHTVSVPGRMAGAYALRGGQVATLFLRREPDPALPADRCAALRDGFGDLGWVLPDLLAGCPDPSEIYYDQVTQVELPRWSSGRVVLLGDACQAVSLFAGHGASLAIAGASILAEELRGDTAADRASLAGALDRYEQRMRPTVDATQELGRRTVRWMAPPNRWRLLLRDAIVTASGLPGLDRLLVRSLTPGSHTLIRPAARSEREPARRN
ncbi:FAD-dependent oxidoreductase [Lysobacter korlensis]|uniref:FAD-dependent oxidoreductase n=1 Tax=Lysobacter korlensis TaxID=553636 RepID=A0ABV6RXM7_9GAMM